MFVEDPGTHDDRYYVEAYIAAPTLSSESIEPFIDLDTWQDGIIETVMAYIEDIRNGNTNRTQVVNRFWLPRYRRHMNKHMSEKRTLNIMNRECG